MTDSLRETLFNMLSHRIDLEGAEVWDLFAGCGSMSYELLSRGAAHSTAVELNPVNLKFIADCATKLRVTDRITVRRQPVEQFLAHPTQPVDFIFLDPPYKLMTKAKLVEAATAPACLRPDGLLVMHHPANEAYAHLPGFAEDRRQGGACLSFFHLPDSTV